MKNLLPGLMFACLLLALVALFMRPRASLLDLQPETATEITARVLAEEETERARIAADAERTRQRTTGAIVAFIVLGLAVPATVAALAFGRAAQARAAQPPLPPHLLAEAAALLAARPGREMDVVDGEWVVVDHDEQRLYPLAVSPARYGDWIEQ